MRTQKWLEREHAFLASLTYGARASQKIYICIYIRYVYIRYIYIYIRYIQKIKGFIIYIYI
jgi:hypothetical protein